LLIYQELCDERDEFEGTHEIKQEDNPSLCSLFHACNFFPWVPRGFVCSFNLPMPFLQLMSHYATADHEKERLKYFASPEGRDDLYQYNQKERRTVLEVSFSFCSLS